jgi:hypothetical protein
MKKKGKNIVILIVLLVLIACWFYVPSQFRDNYEWIIYVLSVPTVFFIVRIFLKLPSEKTVQSICFITLGVIVSLLLSTNFNFSIFVYKTLSMLFGAILLFFAVKSLK